MQPLLNIAINAARQAGDIIRRYVDQLDKLNITAKNDHDFFTEVDVKAEQIIIKNIHKAYPEHGIIAEESGVMHTDSDTTWIIDPLDGTNNFLHGFPFYAVAIAVRVKNRLEHAVVYDPIRHECFAASRGRGAQLNDRRIRVSKQFSLSQALLGMGLSKHAMVQLKRHQTIQEQLIGKCAGMRRTGSAALDLAYVACGRLDGFVETNLKIWDIAAASLIIREAGGLVSDFKGHDDYLNSGNIVAGNPKIFKSLLQIIHTK